MLNGPQHTSDDCSISVQPRPLCVDCSLCTTCNPFASVNIFSWNIDKIMQTSLFTEIALVILQMLYLVVPPLLPLLHGVYWTLFFFNVLFYRIDPKTTTI
jgi:hypothetical protein